MPPIHKNAPMMVKTSLSMASRDTIPPFDPITSLLQCAPIVGIYRQIEVIENVMVAGRMACMGFVLPHPCHKNKNVTRMGHPSPSAWGRNGRLGFVLSHPWRKNKDAPRIGHPTLLAGSEGLVDVRGFPCPRIGRWGTLGLCGGSCFPTHSAWCAEWMGHPAWKRLLWA